MARPSENSEIERQPAVGTIRLEQRGVRIGCRHVAFESQHERSGDLDQRPLIHQLQRLARVILVILQNPTADHRAAVGENHVEQIGVDIVGLLGVALHLGRGGFGSLGRGNRRRSRLLGRNLA